MTTEKTTLLEPTGLSRIDLANMPKEKRFNRLKEIGTTYDEEGRSCLYIPDHLWKTATSMDYIEGIPMLMKRR
jgi:hypothetical protein